MSDKGNVTPVSSVAKTNDVVTSKLLEFENRITSLEHRAVQAFVRADSFFKRNGDWIPWVTLAVGVIGGHVLWR